MKKFFAVWILAAIIFICGQNNFAQAREVYVGSYSDGSSVYLLTETVEKVLLKYMMGYDCTVRAGGDYLKYQFIYYEGVWRYNNSEGYQGYVYDGSSPVAAATLNYIKDRW